MANPLETLTKVVGFGIQQGTKVLGGAISTVTGRGGDDASQQEEQRPQTRAERQRQQQQKAASQRRASQQPKALDDVTITRKVESEIFRGSKVDKGKISVNTAEGIVWLRGEAKNPEKIKELEAKTRAIPEVKEVENLLHLPKTPASDKKRRKAATAAASPRKRAPKRTTAERKPSTPAAEPTPKELAKTGEGRRPAPLGSSGNGGSGSGSGG
jgi:hypothetical protein